MYIYIYVYIYICIYIYTYTHVYTFNLHDSGPEFRVCLIGSTGCQFFFPALRPRAARRVHAGPWNPRVLPSSMDGGFLQVFLQVCNLAFRPGGGGSEEGQQSKDLAGGHPWFSIPIIPLGGAGKTNGMNCTMFRQSHFLLKWPRLILGEKLKADRYDVFGYF